jgi:hypothetical protein
MRSIVASRPLTPVGLLLLAASCGCRPGDAPRALVVVVSGDTSGWIVPCGCTSNQSGGLPRRASYLKQLRAAGDVLTVDVGGAPAGRSLYDRLKFAAICRGEVAMGLVAHNLGAAEVRLGPAALGEIARDTGAPFLSSNAADAAGRPIAAPLRIVERAGRRVALLGVLDESFATPEIQVAPPRQALSAAIARIAGKYDALLVLAYLPEDSLQQLAAALPEADLVVGGPTGQTLAPRRIGPTLLSSATNKGKFLVRAVAPAEAGEPWSARVVELDAHVPDDPGQIANVKRFYAELARRDLTPGQTSLAAGLDSPPGYRIAGSSRCRACHEEAQQTWQRSRHAHAWGSLLAKQAHVDPDCQRCHTTGYGQPGGFASALRSPSLVGVGCESCHGPSLAHVEDPQRPTGCAGAAQDRCRDCHDRENSPKFEYHAYWTKIFHGPAEKPAATAAAPGKGDAP